MIVTVLRNSVSLTSLTALLLTKPLAQDVLRQAEIFPNKLSVTNLLNYALNQRPQSLKKKKKNRKRKILDSFGLGVMFCSFKKNEEETSRNI